jgi:hypothetical protein
VITVPRGGLPHLGPEAGIVSFFRPIPWCRLADGREVLRVYRSAVTETEELAAALDEAATRWPQLSRGQLITRLALEGYRLAVVRPHHQDRLEALRQSSGALTGVYPPGQLEELREDWPE